MKADLCVIAYIGLGSNLHDPAAQIISALAALSKLPQTHLEKRSSLYRSAPMGPQDQPDYINAVAALITALTPRQLLVHLQGIELAQGRIRNGEKWGPRTLDLDLLLYGDRFIAEAGLTVPHPGLHERNFVLYPLAEIAPEIIVPGKGPLTALINHLPEQGLQRITLAESV